MKYRKLKPYIRRVKRTDTSERMGIALQLALYEMRNKKGYVLLQHGVDGVLAIAPCKNDLMPLCKAIRKQVNPSNQ